MYRPTRYACFACLQLRLTVSGSAACPTPIMQRWEQLSGEERLCALVASSLLPERSAGRADAGAPAPAATTLRDATLTLRHWLLRCRRKAVGAVWHDGDGHAAGQPIQACGEGVPACGFAEGLGNSALIRASPADICAPVLADRAVRCMPMWVQGGAAPGDGGPALPGGPGPHRAPRWQRRRRG